MYQVLWDESFEFWDIVKGGGENYAAFECFCASAVQDR
jgi:hypothetical protein